MERRIWVLKLSAEVLRWEQGLRGQETENIYDDSRRFLAVRVGHVFGFDAFIKQGFEIGGRGFFIGGRGRLSFQRGQGAHIYPEAAALGALIDFIIEPAVETVAI